MGNKQIKRENGKQGKRETETDRGLGKQRERSKEKQTVKERK
jgi:hypothetical protein